MWSLCAWVQTMARSVRPPSAASMAAASWAASMTIASVSSPTIQTLLSTSQLAAVEGEGAGGDQVVDAGGHQKTAAEQEDVAVVHPGEGLLDVSQADRLGDEGGEVEPALLVEVDEHREVAGGQAVAIAGGLERAAAAEDVQERQFELHVRGGDADEDDRSGEVAGVEGLLVRLRAADGLDDDVGAVAVGEGADRLDRVVGAGVDGVGGAHLLRRLQLAVVDVDRDDLRPRRPAGLRRSPRHRHRRSR
ncbi:hypothetical protein SMICM17S_11848 [Streptomyces microflavus]